MRPIRSAAVEPTTRSATRLSCGKLIGAGFSLLYTRSSRIYDVCSEEVHLGRPQVGRGKDQGGHPHAHPRQRSAALHFRSMYGVHSIRVVGLIRQSLLSSLRHLQVPRRGEPPPRPGSFTPANIRMSDDPLTHPFVPSTQHPGGDEVLFGEVGRDATEAFEDVGHSDEAREILAKYYVGEGPEVSRPFPSRCRSSTFYDRASKCILRRVAWLGRRPRRLLRRISFLAATCRCSRLVQSTSYRDQALTLFSMLKTQGTAKGAAPAKSPRDAAGVSKESYVASESLRHCVSIL